MPDDTHSSAIWAARRIPDNHVAVVANGFTMQEIDPKDPNVLYSPNMFTIAQKHCRWDPSKGFLNFRKVFGMDMEEDGILIARRMFSLYKRVAPNLPISPFTSSFYDMGFGPKNDLPYPESVPVEKLLSVEDVFRLGRDQFDGTQFDMSQGLLGGPFGDSARFLVEGGDEPMGVKKAQLEQGMTEERAVSNGLTAYCTVTQSRGHLPDLLGAKTWFAPGTPHISGFFPVYASAKESPKPLKYASSKYFL